MLSFKTFAAALLAGGALLAAAAFAQGTGRWTTGAPMPSARTEVAVAEVGGKIYVVGGFGGERELEIYDPAADRWSRGAVHPARAASRGGGGLKGQALRRRRLRRGLDADRRGARIRPGKRPLAAARRSAHTARRAGGCRARWQDPRSRWRRLARPQHPSARGLRSCRQPMDGARLCPDGARPLGGRRDGRTPLRRGRPHRRQLFAQFGGRTRRTIPQPIAGSSARRCPRRAAASRRRCSTGGCSCSAARHPPAPSTRRKPTMPEATAGAAMRACRRRDTASARRRSRARIYVISGGPTPGASASAANEIFVP